MCPISSWHHPRGRSEALLPTVMATSTPENPQPHSLPAPIFLNFKLPSNYLAKQALKNSDSPRSIPVAKSHGCEMPTAIPTPPPQCSLFSPHDNTAQGPHQENHSCPQNPSQGS